MEGYDEFRDWEILLGSDSGEDSKPLRSSSEDDAEDGVIKFDYFGIDSGKCYHKGAAFVDSDNPSWIDPESDPRCDDHDRTKGEVSFPGIRLSDGFGSDESSEEKISPFCSEKWWADAEEDVKVVDAEGIKEIATVVVNEDLAQEDADENAKIHISSGDLEGKNAGLDKALARGEEKRGTVWWKFPFELLKFCAFNVKPVWSISIAAAILGVMMLGRRLYRMKEKTRSIPLRIILDEKKASRLKVHAARLNEAFSIMRRAPITRPSLHLPAA